MNGKKKAPGGQKSGREWKQKARCAEEVKAVQRQAPSAARFLLASSSPDAAPFISVRVAKL